MDRRGAIPPRGHGLWREPRGGHCPGRGPGPAGPRGPARSSGERFPSGTSGRLYGMLTLVADPVPIREESDGALRVGGTRVLLELVIDAFEDGATPESIIQRYPTLTLADTYSVISYYLRHHDEVADYLARRREKAGDVARKIEAAGR